VITGGPGARRAYARLVTRTTRLTVVLLLNLALVAGLVVAGIGAHSIGVLAAGGDYLADAAAIGISLLAIGLARRAVLLDTLADSAAAAGVAVTGAASLAAPGLSWLDPAIALVIAAVVGYHALRLTREVIITLAHEPPAPPPDRPPSPAAR